jgi:CHAT domain-containing protein
MSDIENLLNLLEFSIEFLNQGTMRLPATNLLTFVTMLLCIVPVESAQTNPFVSPPDSPFTQIMQLFSLHSMPQSSDESFDDSAKQSAFTQDFKALMSESQTAPLGFGEKLAELYVKYGAKPEIIARHYRELTITAVSTAQSSDLVVHFNDLTNAYLSRCTGEAYSGALISSDTLRILENKRLAPPDHADNNTHHVMTSEEILDQYSRVINASSIGKAEASAADNCSQLDSAVGGFEMITAELKSSSPKTLEQKLQHASTLGYAYTSIALHMCKSLIATGDSSARSGRVPGYAFILRWKGQFSELIAPRKLTVLPGRSQTEKEYLQAVGETQSLAQHLAALPKDVTIVLGNLIKEDNPEKDPQQYLAKHPGIDRETVIKAYQLYAVYGAGIQKMRAFPGHLQTQDSSTNDDPLALLRFLRPNDILIDIYKYSAWDGKRFSEQHYLAVISSPSSSRAVELGPADPIDQAIKSFHDSIYHSDSADHWKAIERLVVGPLVREIPNGTRRIVLSPDSSIALVPFASLALDMGVKALIVTVPSAYDLARLKTTTASINEKRALIVGDLDFGQGDGSSGTLQGAGSEFGKVKELATKAGFRVTSLSRLQATRTAVIQNVHNVDVMHFATHASGASEEATTVGEAFESAHIDLSGANTGSPDSRLTASDIAQLDLSRVTLVTLSACSTGTGLPKDGQGLLGFQTAFMAAGARSLLVSLWDVSDDATEELMSKFYGTLWADPSISKSEALRQAQMAVRATPGFSAPAYWAGWELLGEGW